MVSGVLLIDKPPGMTSHDVVQRVRRRLGTRKVGHAGTLDPDVTGVLLLCVGDATKLIEYATADDKVYEGTIEFGSSTDTDDAAGKVLCSGSAAALTEDQVRSVAASFVGVIEQTVPRYSAVHVSGKRAYEYARAGTEVELPSRPVEIYSLDVHGFQPGEVAYAAFRVHCSKGTYVRALCRDWGERVGVPAHLHALRRTASGPFPIEEAVPLADFEASDHPEGLLLPPVIALRTMSRVVVTSDLADRLAMGQTVVVSAKETKGETVYVATPDGELVCIAQADAAQFPRVRLKPRKVFWKRDRTNADI